MDIDKLFEKNYKGDIDLYKEFGFDSLPVDYQENLLLELRRLFIKYYLFNVKNSVGEENKDSVPEDDFGELVLFAKNNIENYDIFFEELVSVFKINIIEAKNNITDNKTIDLQMS
jgi:hypothetical protein